jgi:hypothetical protein
MVRIRLFVVPIALALGFVAAGALSIPTAAQATKLPKPGFHHVHMNSPNPTATINEFIKIYPHTTKLTVGGYEGLETENGVLMLFSKVDKAPAWQGPDRDPKTAPLTAFWHHVWTHRDGRRLLKDLRAADPKFDQTRMIWQYTGDERVKVDFSSDAHNGFLMTEQVKEARAKGEQTSGRGGYVNWYGPDGVVLETTDTDGPESYNILGMFEEQPYCALFWYEKHLNADNRPATPPAAAGGRGGAAAAPAARGPTSEADCNVELGEVSWPSTYKNGHHRVPQPQLVVFGDVTMRWYMKQEDRPMTTTRGQLMDHIALSVNDLDAWVAKLKGEKVKFLMQPYKFGDTRAAMIEGPSLEAIELVEARGKPHN